MLKRIFFLFITFLSLNACAESHKEQGKKNQEICGSMHFLHDFKDPNGNVFGTACANRVENSVELFNSMVILKVEESNLRTLYKIEEGNWYKADGSLDIDVFSKGNIGYRLLIAKDDYIVISCCIVDKSDDITIEWNTEEKVFQVLKAP